MPAPKETAAIHCPHCQKPVMADVVGRHQSSYEAYYIVRHTFAVCTSCEGKVVYVEDGELMPYYDDHGEEQWEERWGDPDFIFPSQERVFDNSVPSKVNNAYLEAGKCYRSGVYTAATIMGRRTLEIICNELGAKGERNLFKKIDKLSKDGTFTGRVQEWARRLREVGNFAAHDPEASFSKQQARLILDFTEALIESSFVLEKKFDEFEKAVSAMTGKKSNP